MLISVCKGCIIYYYFYVSVIFLLKLDDFENCWIYLNSFSFRALSMKS